MQLPETPPPPLAPLWDRVLRARALPPDLDVQLLYVAIKDRLTHPEWEVRLHALRVLADLLPLSGNALSFPFDQVVDNLGHNSPNVRKAALDALKVFCTHCEDTECAARAILDKFSYNNLRPFSSDMDNKINIVTGLILSVPSLIGILKRRNQDLDMFPIFRLLGEKLLDSLHKDVALRSLMKLRRVCGPRMYMVLFSRLDSRIQEKFRRLCETYDEDSLDVYYAPRKLRNQSVIQINRVFNNPTPNSISVSTDSSSDDSYGIPLYNNNNNYAKIIIETEIKFDSDTAITMTVLEQNETESDKYTGSEEDFDNSDRNMLRYSDGDSDEDSDVVVKKVRFGGESVKIRTPDSDNLLTSEDDINQNPPKALLDKSHSKNVFPETSSILNKALELKRDAQENEARSLLKKSGIPLPVINNKTVRQNSVSNLNKVKLKSKSLSELYDYFNKQNDFDRKPKERSGFALTLIEVRSPEKVPSPVESHREVEVLHNLQRSPTLSPRKQQMRVTLDQDRFVVNLVASSPQESSLLSPRPPSPLRGRYDWEQLGIVPTHTAEQLHNTENWIAAVKAADQVHSVLLVPENVKRIEPAATSFIQHMFALSDAVSAARAPAEGAVCAVVRGGSASCVRQVLPLLIARIAREPSPAALPHALLQRMALHHIVELIFEEDMIGVSEKEFVENAQLQAALCLARAAGPAAVLAAVRRRLNGSPRADPFCTKLRERLNKPVENIRPSPVARISQLPVPTHRRARSTPPAAPPPRPRRLRPLPDSAPLPGITPPGKDFVSNPLSDGGVSRNDAATASGMRRLCCCCHDGSVFPAPATPDLVADLPSHTRGSSEVTNPAKEEQTIEEDIKNVDEITNNDIIENETKLEEESDISPPPRTPSIHIEDLSQKSNTSLNSIHSNAEHNSIKSDSLEIDILQKSETPEIEIPSEAKLPSEKTSPTVSIRSETKSVASKSGTSSPIQRVETPQRPVERDVRTALVECIVPPRHEDWEMILSGLLETERLANDEGARAPASSWRAVSRATSHHVRSLRSRVARAACSALGALFEQRGRALETELDEAAAALLERCADVNRFLRADAAAALGRVACGSGLARAGVALARRGATHRAGPVRAAAAQALARLIRQQGAARVLELPSEPRTVILRAAGELLADASADTRLHARHLCLALAEDFRFKQMLKEAMSPSRYRAIEKYVDRLRCR